MKAKYVSARPAGGRKDHVGIGYIIIPRDIDRKTYINKCYRTSTVSLILENGGVLDNVLVAKHILNELDFPETFKTQGSLLIWINQPRKQQPLAIGSLNRNNEFVNFSKDKAALRRATANFVSEVIVDAATGAIILTSNSSIDSGGDIYITSTNKNKTSKLKVNVSQDITFESQNLMITNSDRLSFIIKDLDIDEKVTEFFYKKGEGFGYKDEFDNEFIINQDNIQFKPYAKFNVGDGTEPMLLSDTFKGIFEDLTDLISKLATEAAKLQVGTSMGPSTVPTNAANFSQIALDLNELKTQYVNFQSQIAFTD